MRASCILLLILLPLTTPAVLAQSQPQSILAQLQDRPLFLRGCWQGDKLNFNHDGTPEESHAPWSFTLSGIDVEKAVFHDNALELQGHRVGLEFERNGTSHRVRLQWHGYSGKVTVRIAGQPGEDFGPALQAIFAPDLASLLPSMHRYWRSVGDHYLQDASANAQADAEAEDEDQRGSPDGASSAMKPSEANMEHVGREVIPPVLLGQVNPAYTDVARGMRYSARVEVYLWVGPSGRVSHLDVVKPAGLGLDENALAAVAAYRFKPATRNGQPVLVDLYVDVNFQIF